MYLPNGQWVPDPLNQTPPAPQNVANGQLSGGNMSPFYGGQFAGNIAPKVNAQTAMLSGNIPMNNDAMNIPSQLKNINFGQPRIPPPPSGNFFSKDTANALNPNQGFQYNIDPGIFQGMNNPQQQMPPTQQPSGQMPPNQMPPTGGGQALNQMPNAPVNAQPTYPGGFNNYGYYAQNFPQPLPQSVTQSVNNSSPQSVQNFLQALQQAKMSGGQNAWRNQMGAQGQGPQAGFQGFGQPMPQPQGPAPVQYQAQQQQLGSQQNQASAYSAPSVQQQYGSAYTRPGTNQGSVQAGGTGGVQGQPKYQAFGGAPTHTPANNPQQNFGGPPVIQQPQQPAGPAAPKTPRNPEEERQPTGYKDYTAASDVNVKQDINPATGELQNFLNSLGVYDYEYKDPKYGQGRRISPMAQEIEKTPLGKAAISVNEEGYKMVDYGKLGGTMLASLALLNHKYNELEKKLKSGIKEGLKTKDKIK